MQAARFYSLMNHNEQPELKTMTVAFDIQQNLPLPKTSISEAFMHVKPGITTWLLLFMIKMQLTRSYRTKVKFLFTLGQKRKEPKVLMNVPEPLWTLKKSR